MIQMDTNKINKMDTIKQYNEDIHQLQKEKDEYKEYGIRWDSHNKYWYMNGVINQKLIDKIDKIEFEEQYNFIDED